MLHILLIALAVVGGIAAIIAFCMIITRRQTRRRNQQLLDSYRNLLAQHNIAPDFSQVFGHRILALDTNRGVFVFVQQDEVQPSVALELSGVSDCRLWKDGIQVSRKRGVRPESVEEYVSAIGLSFQLNSGEAVNIPIYTEALDGVEEKLALSKATDQWLQRIKLALASRNNPRMLIQTG